MTMAPGTVRATVAATGAAVLAAVVAALALHRSQRDLALNAGVTDWWLLWVTTALAFTAAGAWLTLRQAGLWIGRLLLVVGALSAVSLLGVEYGVRSFGTGGDLPLAAAAFWVANWVWAVALLLIAAVLPLVLPDGRLPSPRWRPALWVAGGSVVASGVGWAVTPYESWSPALAAAGVVNPVGLTAATHPAAEALGFTLIVAGPVVGVAGLAARWRGASGVTRQQLKWILFGLAVSLALFAAGFAAGPLVTALAVLPLPAGCAAAALRYGLWDVDLVISRSLAYGALTACIVAAYVGVVGGVGMLLGRTTGAPLVATALVAIAVEPLHRRLRAVVNRLVHGEVDDPFTALARLGARMEAAEDPTTVARRMLPELVASVAGTLHLPYAAVELADGTRIQSGRPDGELTRLPLRYGAAEVGRLVVSPHDGGLGRSDRALLDRLARQVAVAAHGLLLAREVARSRRQVVTAREEERRHIYRELHDGIGPSLAALALTVETARDLVAEDPDRSVALLDRAVPRLKGTIGDVRAVVGGLRPPALDDLGLAEALRELAARFADSGLEVTVRADGRELAGLGAATEVAAYRIVAEALTNVSRHAAASRAEVSVARDADGVVVAVADDGRGLADPADPADDLSGLVPPSGSGLGLASMRRRAAELGGQVRIGAGLGGRGTGVRAVLPVDVVAAGSL